MKKIVLGLCMLPILLFAQAEYTVLEITDIIATDKSGSPIAGSSFNVYLKDGSANKENTLVNKDNLNIKASFTISSNNTRRSSTKSGSVRVTVTYYSEFNGKKDKRNTEYIFYLDDERKFDVKEVFVFKNGLKPIQYVLTYKGRFRD